MPLDDRNVGQYTIARGGEKVAGSYIIGGRRLSSLPRGLLEAGLHAVAAGYRRDCTESLNRQEG